ncbi:hypothetical protein AB0L85_10165 [Streptomyces sp. NPDC052051]|uniref:hypothetical protein n=1 Tax=Streptomyces sp. NPDC052051 TaxID=3154649 RepID=UPI003429DAFB
MKVAKAAATRRTWADNMPKSLPGRVCLAVTLLFMGVMFSAFGSYEGVHVADGLKYSTRVSGTPGLLTIELCNTSGIGKQRTTHCYGTFRSDDHQVVDRWARIGDSFEPRTVLPVQREASGYCHTVGVAPTAGRLAGICGCALALAIGLAAFCRGFYVAMPRTGGRIGAAVWSPRAGLVTFRLCKAVGIAFLALGAIGIVGLLAMD